MNPWDELKIIQENPYRLIRNRYGRIAVQIYSKHKFPHKYLYILEEHLFSIAADRFQLKNKLTDDDHLIQYGMVAGEIILDISKSEKKSKWKDLDDRIYTLLCLYFYETFEDYKNDMAYYYKDNRGSQRY